MRTPVPRCTPVGAWVSCEVEPPTCRMFWYIRSSNTARPFLKPAVLTFARLLEVTASLVCCASRPVLAAHSAGFIYVLRKKCERSSKAHELRGRGAVLFRVTDGLDLHFELARELDHVDHGFGSVDVAGLERARGDLHGSVRRCIAAVFHAEQAVVAAHELLARRIDELEAADRRSGFGALPLRHDGNRSVACE